jgi:Cadherin domain
VVTATTLDREKIAQYSLTVRCRDAGSQPRTTDLALVVNVLDVNDNSPVFSSQTYRGTLVENNFIGMSILQVSHRAKLSANPLCVSHVSRRAYIFTSSSDASSVSIYIFREAGGA